VAVYERAYRPYEGVLTPERGRFLILSRYAWREIFSSKLFTILFAGCFLFPVAFALIIYLNHNLSALTALKIPQGVLLPVISKLFMSFALIQSLMSVLLALIVGPSLVSPDLSNNGLALYLCRPFSRTEYVLGKMTVLVVLLSAVTWVPGLILFLLQAYLQGNGWMTANLRVAGAMSLAFWMLILVVSLMTLAASAWVRRKFLAAALVAGTFYVSLAFAAAVNGLFGTHNGHLLDLSGLIITVFARLFGHEPYTKLSLMQGLVPLAIFCVFCLLLLSRKVRAYEVVR
jgi:ABC-2 type transport system permease protein